MPAEHDLDPNAMTDEERRAKRRYHAGFAFEMMHPALCRSQFNDSGERNDDDGDGDGDGGGDGGE